jgi:hypothetical protein
MKVKCIDNNGWSELTIGKIYNIIDIDNDNDYWLINDNGYECWYSEYLFKLLSEIRNEKIDKLLE